MPVNLKPYRNYNTIKDIYPLIITKLKFYPCFIARRKIPFLFIYFIIFILIKINAILYMIKIYLQNYYGGIKMSFDGIVTRALVKELNENIYGGRIDKIYQQEKDEILVHIHNKGENYKLLISVSSNNSRAYLTKTSKLNPDNPPMFCMLLRKHIQGGYILNIEQFQLDRVISMDIQSPNEMGELTVKTLIFELMGKWSNIILIEKSTKRLLIQLKEFRKE